MAVRARRNGHGLTRKLKVPVDPAVTSAMGPDTGASATVCSVGAGAGCEGDTGVFESPHAATTSAAVSAGATMQWGSRMETG